MYIKEILHLLTWPVMIIITYYLVKFAMRRYRKVYPEDFNQEEKHL